MGQVPPRDLVAGFELGRQRIPPLTQHRLFLPIEGMEEGFEARPPWVLGPFACGLHRIVDKRRVQSGLLNTFRWRSGHLALTKAYRH